MILDRTWSTRILMTLTTVSLVFASYGRHRDLSQFYNTYTDFTKVSNISGTRFDEKFVVETMEVPLPSHNYYHHHHHNNYYHKQQHHKHMGGPLKVPHLRHHHVSHRGPYFENVEGQEINGSEKVVHLGDTAFLDCRVVMLSGKMVMWIRQYPDKALLTVGKNTHIADDRYSVSFKYPNNWRLMITSIQKEDRGLYVCQVNTHPPRMLVTNVTILAPDVRIVDESDHELHDRYYNSGSVIELTCVVRPSRPGSKIPDPVWKKNGEALPDDVNVYHTNGPANKLQLSLRIEYAKKSDSGEFSCTIGQFSTTVVNIHVLNGEKQAAVHHDQWNTALRLDQNLYVTFISVFLICYQRIVKILFIKC
uniref:Ig-like domain-containing protein n=1 Tax=Trichogramma kaykai TaxID=54128 RepID=A0ABD2X8I7_9HYME